MTMVQVKRLPDGELTEIGLRLRQPLTDDGYRVWYRADVAALLEEVLALRRDRAETLKILGANPPLEGLDQTADLAEVASRLTALWVEQQQGVWQRAEVKRIRERLAAAEQAVATTGARLKAQDETIAALQERGASVSGRLAATLYEAQQATVTANNRIATAEAESARLQTLLESNTTAANRAINATRADAQRRIDAITEDLRLARLENQRIREEVGQAITSNQQSYAKRADVARDLLREALQHFEN